MLIVKKMVKMSKIGRSGGFMVIVVERSRETVVCGDEVVEEEEEKI